jgi:nitrite reductase (NADH) small subunit
MSHPMAERGPTELVSVGRVEDWKDGGAREVKVHKKPMTIVRMGERFFALNSICPHMGGPMSCGSVRDGKIYCPWHDWGFDIETGESPNGHHLDRYRVEVVGEEVMVGWVV